MEPDIDREKLAADLRGDILKDLVSARWQVKIIRRGVAICISRFLGLNSVGYAGTFFLLGSYYVWLGAVVIPALPAAMSGLLHTGVEGYRLMRGRGRMDPLLDILGNAIVHRERVAQLAAQPPGGQDIREVFINGESFVGTLGAVDEWNVYRVACREVQTWRKLYMVAKVATVVGSVALGTWGANKIFAKSVVDALPKVEAPAQ